VRSYSCARGNGHCISALFLQSFMMACGAPFEVQKIFPGNE
jgi:hypothetical protein